MRRNRSDQQQDTAPTALLGPPLGPGESTKCPPHKSRQPTACILAPFSVRRTALCRAAGRPSASLSRYTYKKKELSQRMRDVHNQMSSSGVVRRAAMGHRMCEPLANQRCLMQMHRRSLPLPLAEGLTHYCGPQAEERNTSTHTLAQTRAQIQASDTNTRPVSGIKGRLCVMQANH